MSFFGERLDLVRAYEVQRLPNGGVLILTAASPLEFGTSEVRRVERQLLDTLGREAFFDPSSPDDVRMGPAFPPELRQPPSAEGKEIHLYAQ